MIGYNGAGGVIIRITRRGGIARFTRVLFMLPCYLQFQLEIHIVEVSYQYNSCGVNVRLSFIINVRDSSTDVIIISTIIWEE